MSLNLYQKLKLKILITILFFLALPIKTFSQFSYLGLRNEKLEYKIGKPKMTIKQDTLFVPTKNGLFKKSIYSKDTTWIATGFQGMIITDYILIGSDTIICIVDSTENNIIFISTNNGKSAYNSTNGFGGSGSKFIKGSQIDTRPDNHKELIALSGMCIARSTDFSQTWSVIEKDWGMVSYQSNVLQYHPLNYNFIFSAGELSLFDSFINSSFDNGNSWMMSCIETNNAVNGIAFHTIDTNQIFVGKEGRIERSFDLGITWETVFLTPNYEYIFSIVFNDCNPNVLYASGSINGPGNDTIRIFQSIDGGDNWELMFKMNLPDAGGIANMLFKDNTFFLLTFNGGIYRYTPVTSIKETVCEKYFSPSGKYTWTASGIYNDTLVSSLGCDSILSINLTIVATDTSISVMECDSFISPSGKHIWKTSGTYYDTLVCNMGCDSIITVDLYIDTSLALITKVENQLQASTGNSYIWFMNDTVIEGANSQILKPLVSGNYYAEVTIENGCKRKTNTINFDFQPVLRRDPLKETTILLWPNPVENRLNIESGFTILKKISIYCFSGEKLLDYSIHDYSFSIDLSNLKEGLYLIEIKADQETRLGKIIKK